MIVPWQDIPEDSLNNMISELVTRDGTDYGEQEIPLERRMAQVLERLRRGDMVVVYDEESDSVAIIGREQLPEGHAG